MSLRARLFLLFGGLLAVMVVGQWLLVRTLTADLSEQFGEVAMSVGQDIITGVADIRVMSLPEDSPLPTAIEAQRGELTEGEPRAITFGFITDDPEKTVTTVHDTQETIVRDADGHVIRRTIEKGTTREFSGDVTAGDGTHEVMVELNGDTHFQMPSDGQGRRAVRVERFEMALDHPANARVLLLRGPNATAEIPIPRMGVQEALDRTTNRMFLGSVGILLLGLMVAGLVAHRVSAPLRGLAAAARTVGEGGLGVQAPLRGGGEVASAIASFNRMSTRLRELDAATRELRAQQHLTEIGEIGRGLAHSLRNPLNALGLSLEELAAKAGGGQEPENLVESARRQIRRIDGSIRSFLALASDGAGKVESVNLVSLVQDVALEALHDNRHQALIDVQQPETDVVVQGVAPELRAVLQALMINAVEASPDGGRVRVSLVAATENEPTRVEIQDEGPGLAPEVRERLFTPHVTTKATGSGMGLFLAHRIATARYGGDLTLQPAEPRGTCAVLQLGDREG